MFKGLIGGLELILADQESSRTVESGMESLDDLASGSSLDYLAAHTAHSHIGESFADSHPSYALHLSRDPCISASRRVAQTPRHPM